MRHLMLIFSLTAICCWLSTVRALPHSLRSLQYYGKESDPILNSQRMKKWYSWSDSDTQIPDITKKWYDWQDSGPSEIRKRSSNFDDRDFLRSVVDRFEWKFSRL